MTNRCAVLVDAGYLWQGLSDLFFEGIGRADIFCHYDSLVSALADRAVSVSGRELLRVYWYDGAVNRLPTEEQRRVGEGSDVKLRLGRLVGGRQKGVDSLIVVDLVKLGAAEQVDAIFLLGGDDDLTEGVRVAQDHGARVVVWGIPGEDPSVSQQLVLEADGFDEIESDFWEPHVERRDDRTPAEDHLDDSWYHREGQTFGTAWVAAATSDRLTEVLRMRPRIPRGIDGDLLRSVAAGKDLDAVDRLAAREGFWHVLDRS